MDPYNNNGITKFHGNSGTGAGPRIEIFPRNTISRGRQSDFAVILLRQVSTQKPPSVIDLVSPELLIQPVKGKTGFSSSREQKVALDTIYRDDSI